MPENTLYYGDNLDILREYIADASVDLVYLDPPFNSNRNYNVLFRDEKTLQESPAQITAFEDTWHWNPEVARAYEEVVTTTPPHVSQLMGALRQFIGTNQMMAYLVMMAARLVELHRVLKPTGSLYLHCDPTASHYLKVILDTIFGVQQFHAEIIWKRTSAHSDTRQGRKDYGRVHDVILYYTKGQTYTWTPIYLTYDLDYVDSFYRHVEPATGRRYSLDNLTAAKPGGDVSYEWNGVFPYKGRYWAYSREKMEQFEQAGRLVYTSTGMPRYKRYLDEMPGVSLQDLWIDIQPTGGNERLGYPTQKPLALLERIIAASSNPGDVVLDPFCGCGTAIAAAQKLGRTWLGIDITHLSVALQKYRLADMFPGIKFKVVGEPTDLGAAQQLAADDRYQFQWWALSLIRAKPLGGQEGSKAGKKGSDKGIDGVITFVEATTGKPQRVLIQVKSGHVKSGDIRDLAGTLQREAAAIGVFITLEPPSKDMVTEAATAGFYTSPWGTHPRLQILTVQDLLSGKRVDMPPLTQVEQTFKKAPKVQQAPTAAQAGLFSTEGDL